MYNTGTKGNELRYRVFNFNHIARLTSGSQQYRRQLTEEMHSLPRSDILTQTMARDRWSTDLKNPSEDVKVQVRPVVPRTMRFLSESSSAYSGITHGGEKPGYRTIGTKPSSSSWSASPTTSYRRLRNRRPQFGDSYDWVSCDIASEHDFQKQASSLSGKVAPYPGLPYKTGDT